MNTLSNKAADIARAIWREQIAVGIGDIEEESLVDTDDGLDMWLANRVYPAETLEDAASGDVAAIVEIRREAGLGVFS